MMLCFVCFGCLFGWVWLVSVFDFTCLWIFTWTVVRCLFLLCTLYLFAYSCFEFTCCFTYGLLTVAFVRFDDCLVV